MLDNLKKYNIYLASKSPRRRELMTMLRITFKSCAIGCLDESYPEDMPAAQVPEYLSRKKAEAYRKIIVNNELIITADTLVIADGKIFGKPKDNAHAEEMLLELSGRTHDVITGVTIITAEKSVSFSTVTKVTFGELTKEEVRYYVENFHPLDKAGAYGIQEWIGAVAISGIVGSYYNVMGLPVHALYKHLKEF